MGSMLSVLQPVEAGQVVYDRGLIKLRGFLALKMGVSGSQSLQLEHIPSYAGRRCSDQRVGRRGAAQSAQ